jgi:hypothetical protein
MDIEEEINDKAEHIVRLLKKGSFFEEYPFILPVKLKLTLQASMYKKYKSEGVVDLDTKELGLLIHNLNRDGLSSTLYELNHKGYLRMAVNKEGELVYALSDTSKSIEFLNKRQKFLLETFTIKK